MRTIALLLFLCSAALADEVELSTGEVIRDCKVVTEGENYRIYKGAGSRLVAKTEVKTITYAETLDDQYVKKAKELKDEDLDGHLKLAKWCIDRQLPKRLEEEYRKILAIDTDHAEARAALGFQRHLGQWLTEEEFNVAQGLVKHRGRWVSPEERDLDLALDQLKETEKKYFAEVKKHLDRVSSADEDKVKDAKDSLAKLDDKYKVKHFIAALRSSNRTVRLFVVEELRRFKEEVLKVGDATVYSAVKQLARLGIWDDSLDVRSAAMKAIAAIAHAQTAEAFLPYLAEESISARMRTEDALAEFKSLKSVPPLFSLLSRTTETLAFIEQYEKQIAQVIRDSIVLKNGQKVPMPANLKISPTLFEPQTKRLLAEERDSIAATLRAISGQDYGSNAAKWKAWYDAQKK